MILTSAALKAVTFIHRNHTVLILISNQKKNYIKCYPIKYRVRFIYQTVHLVICVVFINPYILKAF